MAGARKVQIRINAQELKRCERNEYSIHLRTAETVLIMSACVWDSTTKCLPTQNMHRDTSFNKIFACLGQRSIRKLQ